MDGIRELWNAVKSQVCLDELEARNTQGMVAERRNLVNRNAQLFGDLDAALAESTPEVRRRRAVEAAPGYISEGEQAALSSRRS